MKNIDVVLYDDFTALDVFGPVEVLCNLKDYEIRYISLKGGVITNRQGIRIETDTAFVHAEGDILLVPGGLGSRKIIMDSAFIETLYKMIEQSRYVLSVCTGSALVARTGALDNRNATSNKTAFEWVCGCRPEVKWNREARWVADGKFYTSAGVSAGIDMALGFVRDHFGEEEADRICRKIEYHWNRVSEQDSF